MFREHVRPGVIYPTRGRDLLPGIDLNRKNTITEILNKSSLISKPTSITGYYDKYCLLAYTKLFGPKKRDRDEVGLSITEDSITFNIFNRRTVDDFEHSGFITIEMKDDLLFFNAQLETATFNFTLNGNKINYTFHNNYKERQDVINGVINFDSMDSKDNVALEDFASKSFITKDFNLKNIQFTDTTISFDLKTGNYKGRRVILPRRLSDLF